MEYGKYQYIPKIPEASLKNFRTIPSVANSFFVSFEGIECSGKTTQIVLIQDYLEKKGFRVLVFREPGGTPFGEQLRKAMLNASSDIHPLAEAYLFASGRAHLIHHVVLKELNEPNTIIICDRYIDSSFAYQGVARGLGMEEVMRIHSLYPLNLLPHRSFYIKISREISEKRQEARNMPKDYFEARGEKFHEDLIRGYDWISELFSKRIRIIDGEKDSHAVFVDISREIDDLLLSG